MKSKILNDFAKKGISTLTEYEAKEVLKEYDISTPKEVLLKEDILDKLSSFKPRKAGLDYPLFIKISSRDILHKTDANVITRVQSGDDLVEKGKFILENANSHDKNAKIQGILVSEDVSDESQRELFVGSLVDDQFGHMISFGIGGISIEVYEDVEFRAVPLEEKDVYSMIENLRGKKILREFRGKPPVNMDLLVDIILKFSKLIEENDEIEEVDVNPLFAGPDNVVAVDALITLTS